MSHVNKKNEKKEKANRMSKRARVICIVVAALLAAALIAGLVFALIPRSPVVLSYQNADLRENEYAYWVACYKYHYMVNIRGIEDSEKGWAELTANGESYDTVFKKAIDHDIAMRFVAATLFDASGASLTETQLRAVEQAASDIFEYSYGADVAKYLAETYDIDAKLMKRVGSYEVKYAAYLTHLFGADFSGVYAPDYRDRIDRFYRENYTRYNMVYLTDAKNADAQKELENRLQNGMTEAEFTAFEKERSESPVTNVYPNGIYLYGKTDYSDVFSKELRDAFAEADKDGAFAKKRDKDDKGTYYVMRYALDAAPYLSADDGVKRSLSGFAQYAAAQIYAALLEEYVAEVEWKTDLSAKYTMAAVVKESEYNIVRKVR